MAKTESTAVNELIALVSSQQPVATESGEELMFSSPKPMTAARMTAPLPVVKGAAVPPLPRSRAPSGTQSNPLPTIRASTAPPPRGTTIPPLSKPAASKPPQPTMRMAALPPPAGGFQPRTTQSRPSLPPPIRHSAQRPAEGTPAPEFGRAGSAAMPVAAPFEPVPVAPVDEHPFAAKPAIDDSWFQSSHLVDKVEAAKIDESWGTYQVERGSSTVALIKKLIAPTAVLVLLGVCVGGYLAFNGEGGHKRHAPTAAAAEPAVATEPAKPADETKPATEPKPADATSVAATRPADVANSATKPADATKAADLSASTKPADTAKPTTAPMKPADPAKLAATTPAPAVADTHGMTTIKTTRGEVKLVDVRIDSKPSGATVMLVDRGKTSFLGTTPVSAAVDPGRAYDVVLTAPNHPTQVEHLDPNVSHRLAITLGKPGNQVVAETHHHHHDAPKAAALVPEVKAPEVKAPEVKAPAPKVETKVATPAPAPKTEKIATPAAAPAPKAAAAPSGSGTLMVSSKPPCEIVIDGKPTGLTTPQRSIPLAPGAHKVTFVNATESINKTVAVVINADKPTKLIQDLMKK